MWKSYFVLGPNLMPNNNLIDVIEFIPILVVIIEISEQRLKLWTPWYRKIQSFRCKKALLLNKLEVVLIDHTTH